MRLMHRLLPSVIAIVILIPTIAIGIPNPTQVTTTGGRHPTVSGNGASVAYVGASGIEKVSTSGGVPVPLVAFGREPDWSWVLDRIVFRHIDSLPVPYGIYTVPGAGGSADMLIGDGPYDDEPAWSPLGNEIALQHTNASVTIIAWPAGTTSVVACSDPDLSQCEGESPAWSPDGNQIVFQDGLETLKVARTGGTAEVVVGGGSAPFHPTWSPNGQWIAFAREDDTHNYANIWVTDARGMSFGLVPATEGAFFDSRPTWSPDSMWLFFESDRSGQSEIWKVPFAGITAVEKMDWSRVKALYR